MPVIDNSSYSARGIFRNPHINTVYPALFRKVDLTYERERLSTPDGDFLDLDWSKTGSTKLIIALHGLEGSADRPYIKGMLRHFNDRGWDGLGLNFRGCSGEPNRRLRSYHMGETTDLDRVIQHIHSVGKYHSVVLTGFSLGGNVLLKYLGEKGREVPGFLKGAVAFSVPCFIPSANKEIDHWQNYLYLKRFLNSLNTKIEEKARRFPDQVRLPRPMPKNFLEFDGQFTAPIHGFEDAQDYWHSCSSLNFLPDIHLPTLLINAGDDTFLSKECYPYNQARKMKQFFLEVPRWGGHVGFCPSNGSKTYWSEKRALEFLKPLA